MATSFTFNNQTIILPGAYSTFASGVTNPPLSLSYGNVMIIDTGSGGGYGGGAGIAGELANGTDAVYAVNTLADFRNAIGGGIIWDIAEKLFQPNGAGGGNGVSTLYYTRAAQTTAPSNVITFVGGGGNGGTVTIKCRNEGVANNGIEGSPSLLTTGHSWTMRASSTTVGDFALQFWRGTYRGADGASFDYDGIAEANTSPQLLCTSPDFNNFSDLLAWMTQDQVFGSYFESSGGAAAGTGVVDNADLAAHVGNQLFAGATTTYSTNHLDTVLTAIQGLYYSLVICDQYAADGQSADNTKILGHISDGDTFGDKMMIVGGGADSSEFDPATPNSSCAIANYYQTTDRVVVCHGSPKKTSNLSSSGYIIQTPFHKAASYCGRIAGLPPFIPVTFKTIAEGGEVHGLNLTEQRTGLREGVTMTIEDKGVFRCLQGVTTIKPNNYLINADATTFSIQLRRMIAQVNTELTVSATEQLLKNPDGTNNNTLNSADVKSFVETYLKNKSVLPTQDNMIINFRNVNVVLNNDAYFCTYDVIFNTEITKLFFTGTIYLSF